MSTPPTTGAPSAAPLDAAAEAERILRALESGPPVARAVVVAGPREGQGWLIEATQTWALTPGAPPVPPAPLLAWARERLATPSSPAMASLPEVGDVYLETFTPPPDLVIVGAGHIAVPLAHLGALLGYRVTVLDDRPEFARRDRFPDAAEVRRIDWSDPWAEVPIRATSHIVLVTRGHRYDYDALRALLARAERPAYIGMIGSRRRVRATFAALLAEGVAPERLAEVYAPIGLDIGAETPAEIAVAVAAELVRVRRGGTGQSLRDRERVLARFFRPGRGGRQPLE